ncbi:hypothetical protein ACIBI4_30870 [Streptomyces sp. NPDC050418]|uniref:hypothetical protein n=1 Tax=Streptomyces sp. NPDC050418 TaxID=3365612 RepID=UPI0037A1A377
MKRNAQRMSKRDRNRDAERDTKRNGAAEREPRNVAREFAVRTGAAFTARALWETLRAAVGW